MGLLFYYDSGCRQMLPRSGEAFRLKLPTVRPGGQVTGRFYVYNDGLHPAEGLAFTSSLRHVRFFHPDVIPARGSVEVTVEYVCPETLRAAETFTFKASATEVSRPVGWEDVEAIMEVHR